MRPQETYTCSNCGCLSSRVSLFDDGYVLCVTCKRAMQDRYEAAVGWRPAPASAEDEALRKAVQR